jgi:hypothetical protein
MLDESAPKKTTESDRTALLLFSRLPHSPVSRLVRVVSLLSSALTLPTLPTPPASARRGCRLSAVASVWLSPAVALRDLHHLQPNRAANFQITSPACRTPPQSRHPAPTSQIWPPAWPSAYACAWSACSARLALPLFFFFGRTGLRPASLFSLVAQDCAQPLFFLRSHRPAPSQAVLPVICSFFLQNVSLINLLF